MADSLTSSGKPSWFVQILFGRYRSLGAIQWTHISIIGGIGFIMVRETTDGQPQTTQRYTMWGAHCSPFGSAVLGPIFLSMQLYLYLFFLRRKFNHYSAAIAQLPRSGSQLATAAEQADWAVRLFAQAERLS
jgi:hypothetical protein